MKNTAINFFAIFYIILFTNLSSAIDFQFISPSSSIVNESFSVSISISSSISDNYDVKIFVHDDSKEFCEIYYDGKRNNPYYYLKGVFPQTREFKIKSYFIGSTNICARLRKTNSSSFSEVCNPITIISSSQNQEQPKNNFLSDSSNSSFSSSPLSSSKNAILTDFVPDKEKKEEQEIMPQSEKIYLNKKKEVSYTTEKGNLQLYCLFAFLVLCIFIIIYLLLRRI
ncbi:MAG: hypothetical protein QXO70_04370 [Candidatus Pacearchaeota archaeon]